VFAAFHRISAWRRRREARDSEHGAVAAIVAIMLGGGVLLGSGALVVDVGLLYAEREQLQSGADAASFKVALNCAKDSTVCNSATQTPIGVAYAKKNAGDSQAGAQICLNGTGCPTWNTARTCPPLPTPPAGTVVGNYVEVRTTTLTSAGSNLMPPVFAGALPGMAGYQGSQVGTCARVNWGPPADPGRVFAMGISLCDWKRMTSNGSTFYGPIANLLSQVGLYSVLGLTAPTTGNDSAIPAVLPAVILGLPSPSCTSPINLTVPRGYVWLASTDGTAPDTNCMIDTAVGDYPRSFLLAGLLAGNCATKLQAARASGLPLLVPIFDVIQQALLSVTPAYHIVGFAPFVVTGYTGLLPGLFGGAGSLLSGGGLAPLLASTLCGLSSCVYGYFTKSLVPQSHPTFGSGANYGATVIGRTG
jgi:Flp pilus assembly protein TadG